MEGIYLGRDTHIKAFQVLIVKGMSCGHTTGSLAPASCSSLGSIA